jgi:OmpA-OmpF porin, OOP family
MKNIILSLIFCTIAGSYHSDAQLLKRIKDRVKNTASDHIVNDAGNATDKAIDKTENAAGNTSKGDNNSSPGNDNPNTSSRENNGNSDGSAPAPSLHSYQNYDFVPGDTVLFVDDFAQDQDGEFPSHWNLEKGQAVLNKINGTPAFFLTEGNYVEVYPRMKTKSYLTDPFTIEFDYYPSNDAYGPIVFLKHLNSNGDEDNANVQFDERGGVNTGYFPKDFSATNSSENDETFWHKWHHCAMIYKNNQLKCYVDQNRILVVPNVGFIPYAFGFGGIGSQENPIIITNIRAAKGGEMNMIGKKFTESKIVTHGINFDIDKATIKPESMGTLNMIIKVMKDNPDLKFEIDGHTDNSGGAAHNLTLSQQRADAVKTQLVSMGIDASRLTTKGFGDTKPISDNTSPEGRANNRRVEFVKM